MNSTPRGRLVVPALLLLLAAASCAPVPTPVATTTPPAPATGGGAPPPTAPPATAPRFDLRAEPTIDVGLAWDVDSLALESDAGPYEMARPGGRPVASGLSARRLVLRVRAGGAYLDDGTTSAAGDPSRALTAADTLWSADAGRESRLHWRGKAWRGRFKAFVNPRGKLTLALRVPLETYLLGVVPGEIGALDDKLLEAGRAQAIAARSYTMFYVGRRAAEGFDLFGTVEDQVYGSVESERPVATRCVEDTRGTLALSGGAPIRANYCSTCGGISADVWEAWPAVALPYLRSQRDGEGADWCAASNQYRWREQWSAAELLANVAKYAPGQGVTLPGAGLGELVDVRVASRSRSGRAWWLEISTTTGDVRVPAYAIRQVLRRGGNPAAILKSNLFKIDVRRDPASRRALSVVASGAGSGHGVGLCQTGALGMARAGRRSAAILEHYYPGAEIKKLY